jgi:hypothetical protein
MPDRNSSNELLTEMLREILAERARDHSDGLTLRSIDRRLVQQTEHSDRAHDRLEERVRLLETRQARTEGHDDMHTPAMGFPPVPVAINLGQGHRSKRPSFPSVPSWLRSALKPVAQLLAMVLIALCVHLLGQCSGAK